MSGDHQVVLHLWNNRFVVYDLCGGRVQLSLTEAKRVVDDLRALIKSLEPPVNPGFVSEEEAVGYKPAPDDKSIAHYPV